MNSQSNEKRVASLVALVRRAEALTSRVKRGERIPNDHRLSDVDIQSLERIGQGGLGYPIDGPLKARGRAACQEYMTHVLEMA